MTLRPLEQWWCDSCGELIEKPQDGTVEYQYDPNVPPPSRHVNFRIAHNGNVDNGACQVSSRGARMVGDKTLDRLTGSRGILQMLGVLSTDPSWAETVRRVTVPHYEEARRYFKEAAADGQDMNPEKLTEERLRAIIKAFGE